MKKLIMNNEKAFTFIELVVSIAIIAILLIVGVIILTTSTTTISAKGQETEVFYQAQDAMERLIVGDITDVSGYPDLLLANPSDYPDHVKITVNGSPVEVNGTYYVIKEKETGKVLLTFFIPDSSSTP